jgi:anti-sigma B factor antagonist
LSAFTTPSTSTFTIEQREAGNRTVLAVAGEVDIATSPALQSALQTALEASPQELWVDLCATTFMDSSGMHVLLDSHRLAERLRRRLMIVCPPGNVRRVLDLTGIVNTLRMYDAQLDA